MLQRLYTGEGSRDTEPQIDTERNRKAERRKETQRHIETCEGTLRHGDTQTDTYRNEQT